ncbi:LANO_0F16996g1_1 [Lachancea nothofagi CBS 11611]|uniref:LANO_0F16996g1_1 n=1 Tax=Lachancea nothofagi CBS 11611 TaxID=1266666 RepID=A0A1G4KD48_9SACH|nr:LANO_0F16996g1_1 [Lachancea nothofagi CBS 11611]
MSAWNEAHDPEGRLYYYDAESGETTWEKPRELFTELELKLDRHGWKIAKTEEGQVYYYNQASGESSWEIPTFEEQAQVEPSELQEQAEDQLTKADTLAKPDTQQLEPVQDTKSYALRSKLVEATAKPKLEAEHIFLQMLKDHQIDSTWSFNKIISELSCSDPRYWCVDDDPLWKRRMFEQYLSNRSEDQLLKEHSAVNKFRDAFWAILNQTSQIHYFTRWVTAKRVFANEPIYKHSVVSERTKRNVFQEYVDDLRNKHFTSLQKTKEQAHSELQDYLLAIMPGKAELISWEDLSTKHLFENSTRFTSNRHFQTLSKHDVLKQYITIVETYSKHTEEELSSVRSVNYTNDRKARDRFKQLLDEHSKSIRCNSKWEELYPKFRSDSRLHALLARKGSSPLDLFMDFVEEKAMIMKAHMSIASQILIENNYEWDMDREKNVEKLTDLMKVNHQLSVMDSVDCQILVSKLLVDHEQKLKQQAEVEKRLLEQRKRYFTLLLHRVFSQSNPKPNTFEEACEVLKDYPEFKDLADDEVKKHLFEAFEPNKAGPELLSTSSVSTVPQASKLPKKRQLAPVELDY